jgi:hypothetical protein
MRAFQHLREIPRRRHHLATITALEGAEPETKRRLDRSGFCMYLLVFMVWYPW